VHALDLAKTLAPLTLQPSLLQRSSRVIVIDPGHGADNLGAKSAVSDRYEKEFVLDWARRLAPLLRAQGWSVYLTRTNDTEVSLPDRLALADDVHADLFVSLHFNSSDQVQSRADSCGLETYCLTPVGMPSSLTRHYEDPVNQAFPNNAFDEENFCYAVRLHQALVRATHRKDRGVRRARFMTILRGQNRPAVLLEAGYLTCPSEAQLIASSQYRQKLAEAVAKALTE
jgi:N-acetylmuramoyl-L-alanine amidase